MSKIGIAIPTYNRNNFLVKLLDTIPVDIEISVSDNGNFVTDFIKQSYKHVNFISTNRIFPMYKNWNNAISNINSEWICLASDDDLFLNGAFDDLKYILDKNPTVEVVIFGNDNINEIGEVVSSWIPNIINQVSLTNGFDLCKYGVDAKMIGVFFKKSLYEKVGKFNEEYEVTASDSHFVQKITLAGNTLYVPKIISQYRVWGNNLTSQTIATKAWVDEVIYWQDKIGEELEKKRVSKYRRRNYKDEVIARNMVAGMSSILARKQGLMVLLRYLKQFRYPMYANFRTHLSIIKCLLVSLVKR
jgi:glycosyltransferase involved in cell wall biosynthesis